MNKLAQYLNHHLIGEVLTEHAVIEKFSHDNSPLEFSPEMVAYPYSTSDIRKLMRFSWQLSEKGHILAMTARGSGTNASASAIGTGLIISLTSHMNNILEFDSKQRQIRMQPGVTISSINNMLLTHGMSVPAISSVSSYATVGGHIAESVQNLVYGDWVAQLEVVLASGDVLVTKRLSKREVNKKKGLQTFEGGIYRAIDTLFEENIELMEQLDTANAAGYTSLRDVRNKDGSIDLTPLFFASQGSLGVISELIIKAEYAPEKSSNIIAVFDDVMAARDAIDGVEKINPDTLEYIDSQMLEHAKASGKVYSFLTEESAERAILITSLSDVSKRAQAKKLKKLKKLFEQHSARVYVNDGSDAILKSGTASIIGLALQSSSKSAVALPLLEGMFVPLERFDQFVDGLTAISVRHQIPLPLYGRPLDNLWFTRPTINPKSVGGKQTIFKIISEVADLCTKCGGYIAGENGEGRMQSNATHSGFDEETATLFQSVKNIFDPQGILNVGVKTNTQVSVLSRHLRSEYVSNNPDSLARF